MESEEESGGGTEGEAEWGLLRVAADVQDPYDTIVRILLRPDARNPPQAWARTEL